MNTILLSLVSIKENKITDFKKNHPNLIIDFISGVNGGEFEAKEYFKLGVARKSIPLTPSEVGCSLSHLNIYKEFLKSDFDYLVVFEDDVFIDKNFDLETFPFNEFDKNKSILIHLGGQDGLMSSNKLFGKKIGLTYTWNEFWLVSSMSYRWLWRTCGYVITKNLAALIIKEQEKYLRVADSWKYWINKSNSKVYYVNLVAHPLELINSSIQREREVNKRSSFVSTFKNKLTAIFLIILNKILYTRIK
jgi:glycosyl transferase family 25